MYEHVVYEWIVDEYQVYDQVVYEYGVYEYMVYEYAVDDQVVCTSMLMLLTCAMVVAPFACLVDGPQPQQLFNNNRDIVLRYNSFVGIST
jgi:hypothetical protein